MSIFTQMLVPVLAAQTAANGLIKPLGHHELLLVLVQLSLLLLVARGLGEFMRRINLPPVVGELLAGVVLGPRCSAGFFLPCKRTYFRKARLSPTCSRWSPG